MIADFRQKFHLSRCSNWGSTPLPVPAERRFPEKLQYGYANHPRCGSSEISDMRANGAGLVNPTGLFGEGLHFLYPPASHAGSSGRPLCKIQVPASQRWPPSRRPDPGLICVLRKVASNPEAPEIIDILQRRASILGNVNEHADWLPLHKSVTLAASAKLIFGVIPCVDGPEGSRVEAGFVMG